MDHFLLISDAAKEVQVESHVLRYWEEELHLPIRRNELGHRYYTREDVERFKQIKGMKERGLQLKAIKMILRDGKIDVMMPEEEKEALKQQEEELRRQELQEQEAKGGGAEARRTDRTGTQPVCGAETGEAAAEGILASSEVMSTGEGGCAELSVGGSASPDEKAKRLQWLLQQMIRDTLQESSRELCRDIKESVVKELDYQFRVQEEREEERDRIREEKEEIHYQRLDELLREKSRGKSRRDKGERSLEKKRREELKMRKEQKEQGEQKKQGDRKGKGFFLFLGKGGE